MSVLTETTSKILNMLQTFEVLTHTYNRIREGPLHTLKGNDIQKDLFL